MPAETVTCGTSVLVTDRCGIALMMDYRVGLVVLHDCAALGASLSRIPGASRSRGGCKEVANSLSWTERLAQLECLYRELISERRNQ